jgi:hypothetical protein
MVFVILFFVYVVFGVAQTGAFVAGMGAWLGLGALASMALILVLGILPLGALATSAIAFYGAVAVWGWSWWQAALLTLPFAILGIFTMGTPPLLRMPKLAMSQSVAN